jgi:lipoprotein-releasing system permease protein
VAHWQALLPVLEAMPEVAAVSPMVSGAGLALRGEASQVDRAGGRRAGPLRPHRQPAQQGGGRHARLGPGEAILGRELADDLGVRVGDRVTVVTGAAARQRRRASPRWSTWACAS